MSQVGISVASLVTYSDQDLLTIYRWALANGACGQTREINGRSITFPSAQVIMSEIIPILELRIAAATTGTTAIARTGPHPHRPFRVEGLI